MSCEAASIVCKKIGIEVSADTIIRMLLRNTHEIPFTGESIGIDDWAYRKGHSYGTIVCDGDTGRPIELLPGRDGSSLQKWLVNNKQINTVTRDRASSYSAVVEDVIPKAVQIADRFHLFQNLLDAVKDTLKSLFPEKIGIKLVGNRNTDTCGTTVINVEAEADSPESKEQTSADVEEALPLPQLSKHEEDNRQLILEVQRMSREDCLSNTEIKDKVGISYRRIKRYLSGDADTLCRDGRHGSPRPSQLDLFSPIIQDMLHQGKTRKDIYSHLTSIGYTGSYSRLADYCAVSFGEQPTRSAASKGCDHFVGRKDVLNHVWSDQQLDPYDKEYIFNQCPELTDLKNIVVGFQKAMNTKLTDSLGQWIDTILASGFSAMQSLGKGIALDISAVLNSIRFTKNNAFLEGNVNRLKMIKRTMFGRAKYPLLRAKVLRLCAYF